MPNFRNVFRYLRHYGWKNTAGLIREKLWIDPKRFDAEIHREQPEFPEKYRRAEVPEGVRTTRPLSVLYLIHYFYPKKKGGTERFVLNLAKEQIRRGNRPTVLVLEANEPESAYPEVCGNILFRRYEFDGIPCVAFRHKRAPLGLYYKAVNPDDAEMAEFAVRLLGELRIDVVHAAYPQPFASFLRVCRERSIPYVVTCTDFNLVCHYATMVDNKGAFCGGTEGGKKCARVCKTYGCRNFAERLRNAEELLAGAALVTTPSAFVARVLSQEFPSVAFRPVPHGISGVFSDARETRTVRPAIRKFVYAGTISPLKGVSLLISAFQKADIPDATLDIYGDGDETYMNQLRSMADARVVFHGAVPASDMPRIFADADCVVVPSVWYETYNFVLREAVSAGALGIASDIGAMPEAIDVNRNGFLFRPGDESDLTEKLRLASHFPPQLFAPHPYPSTASEGAFYTNLYRSVV